MKIYSRIFTKHSFSAIICLPALILTLSALYACTDLLVNPDEYGDGTAGITFNLTFRPMDIADMSETRTAGNVMDEIENLTILGYDLKGNCVLNKYYGIADLDIDKSELAGGGSDENTEQGHTMHASPKEKIFLPYGSYHIYALANLTDAIRNSTSFTEAIDTEDGMRAFKLTWHSGNVAANNQMSGWFTEGIPDNHPNDYPDQFTDDYHDPFAADYPDQFKNNPENVFLLNVNKPSMTLHAWMRRVTAKITVAFDGTHLKDNVYIYPISAKICHGALTTQIINNNTADEDTPLSKPGTADTFGDMGGTANQYDDLGESNSEGDLIWFSETASDDEKRVLLENMQNKTKTLAGYFDNNDKWPRITRGDKYGDHQDSNSPNNALFVFENLQGQHDEYDKRQVGQTVGNGQLPDKLVYTEKDQVPYGTYIEVAAYYVSLDEGNEGEGPIYYRFMMGRDVISNFDLERNFHYLLTLQFHRDANNYDWHILYDEREKPGIYAPDPYYVSYLYGQRMEYPIRIEGDITSPYIDVEILESNYRPYDEEKKDWTHESAFEWYNIPDGESDDGPWNGFLSLYETRGCTSIFKDNSNGTKENGTARYGFGYGWNKFAWYKLPYRNDNAFDPADRVKFNVSDYKNTTIHAAAESYTDNDRLSLKCFSKTYSEMGLEAYNTKPELKWTYSDANLSATGHPTRCEGYRRYWVPQGGDGEYYYNTSDPTNSSNTDNNKRRGNSNTDALTKANYDNPDILYGGYRVVKKGNVTTFYIPLYTRPLNLTTWQSYSGNNPFYSFMRKATIRIRAKVKKNATDTNPSWSQYDKTVLQVRRQVNPKIIMRHPKNTNCFTVVLMHRNSEARDAEFFPFTSRGPWTANIVRGEGWEIVGKNSGATGSKIKFTVRPKSQIGFHENKCAMVEVWYHNRSCRHVILLRQGYAPICMEATPTDDTYWHSFNLWWAKKENGTWVGRETDDPINGGSLYRRTNLGDAIDPINNNFMDFQYGGRYNSTGKRRNQNGSLWNADNSGFSNSENTSYFLMAPIKDHRYKRWSDIDNYSTSTTTAVPFPAITLPSEYYCDACEVPTYEDFYDNFMNNGNIELGYGIAYGDGATDVQTQPDRVFRHSYVAQIPTMKIKEYEDAGYDIAGNLAGNPLLLSATDPHGVYGTRVCIVFNTLNADSPRAAGDTREGGKSQVLVLPLGHSGYGHRNNRSNPSLIGGILPFSDRNVAGALRYAGAAKPITGNASKRPYLYTLYTNYGAIYWLNGQKPGHYSWDINYSTYDFNTYESNANNNAAMIRLVQRGHANKPTAAKPGWAWDKNNPPEAAY